MSERVSVSSILPAACSGDMKAGVPATVPGIEMVIPRSPSANVLARPKSRTQGTPLLATIILEGLRSR